MEDWKYRKADLHEFSRRNIVRKLLESFFYDSTLEMGDIYSSIQDFPQEEEVALETWVQFIGIRAHAFVEALSAFRTLGCHVKEQPEKVMKILMALTSKNYPELKTNKIPEKVIDEILELLIEPEP